MLASPNGPTMVDPAVYPYYERLNHNPEDAESLLFLWQWHGDRGEFQALATLAEQVASRRTDPSSAADLFFRAGELWAKNVGRLERAVGSYRRAFELDPNQLQAIEAARTIYLQSGNHKLAVQLFERQLSSTADPLVRLPLLREFAALRGQLGDPSGQAAALEEVIRISPDDYEAMRELAAAYLVRAEAPGGDEADRMRAASLLATIAQSLGGEHSVAFAEAALDAWPGEETAFQLVRDGYLAAGRGDELAVRQIHFVTANPNSALANQVRRELAELYISAGQVEDAIAALEPIAASDPDVTEILVDLYRRANRVTELLALLRTLPPSNDPVQRIAELREIAELCGRLGDRTGMVDAMRAVLGFDPADPEALALVEDDLRNRKAYGELRDVLYGAARAEGAPRDASITRLREIASLSEQRLADPHGAIGAWQTLLAFDPSNAEAIAKLESLYESTERWEDLVAFYAQRAADSRETDRRALLEKMVAVQRDRRQDPAGEAGALAAIWALEPNDDEVALRLVDARRRSGDLAGVTDVLRARADRATPDKALERHIELAEHLESSGERDAALGAWKEVATFDPALPKPWESIERILERTGRLDLLIDTLIAHAGGPAAGERAAPLYARAAEVARSLGDLRTAREQAELALETAPDDESIATLLMDVLEALGESEALITQLRERASRTPDGDVKIALLRRAALALGRTDPRAAGEVWNELRGVAHRTNKGDDAEALEALAGIAELAGDTARLVELLGESARFNTDPSARLALLTRRADILVDELQRPEDAIASLRQIVDDIDPRHEPTWGRIGSIATTIGQHSLAAEALEKRVGLTEDDEARAAIASRLADVCEKELADIPRTLAALEAWYDADPTDYTVVTRMAVLYERESRWPEVIKYLEVLAEVEGDEEELSTLVRRIADIAENKAENPRKAFDVLAPVALQGDGPALDALRGVAERGRLEADLVRVLVELAGKAKNPSQRAVYWREVATRSERGIGDANAALDAWLKTVSAQPGDRAALDEIDRLAAASRNAEAVSKAYATALPSTSVPHEIAELGVRGARVLESVGANGPALDLVLAAQNRAMGEDSLLDVVVRLAPTVNRGDDMFIAFDRRRKASKDDAERYALVLRAAECALVGLGDRDTAYNYLKQAAQQAASGKNPDESRLGLIEDLARKVDGERPDIAMRTGIVELFAQMGEDDSEDNPRIAALLQRHAGRLCFEDLGLPDHAWQLFSRAVTLWPADVASAECLEKVAAQLGTGAAVVDLYQKIIDDAYDAQTARVYGSRRAALLADVLGRVDDALEALRHLVEIAPKDLDAIRTWQSLLRRHGRFQDLLMALERELQAGATDPLAIRKEIALVWEQKLRNAFEAKDAWKKVQKLAPNDPDVKAAFDRLEKKKASVDLDDDLDPITGSAPAAAAEAIDELSASAIEAPPPDELSSSAIESPPPDELSSSAIESPPPDDLSSSEVAAPPSDDLTAGEMAVVASGDFAAAPAEEVSSSEFAAVSAESEAASDPVAAVSDAQPADAPSAHEVTRDFDVATHAPKPESPASDEARRVVQTSPFGREATSELTFPEMPTAEFSSPILRALVERDIASGAAIDPPEAAPVSEPESAPLFSDEHPADTSSADDHAPAAIAAASHDADRELEPEGSIAGLPDLEPEGSIPGLRDLDEESLDAEPFEAEPVDEESLDAEPFEAEAIEEEPIDEIEAIDDEIEAEAVEDEPDDLASLAQIAVAPRASMPPPTPRTSLPPPPPSGSRPPPSGRKN